MMIGSAKQRISYLVAPTLLVIAALSVERTAALEGSATRDQPTSASRARANQTADSRDKVSRRLREGTIISDQSGFFLEDGEGATFVADSGLEFGALPNLNLERVLRLLKSAEEPNSIRWSVTGKVTEFAGRNFLLISRAVYKSATPPPVPDRVAK